MIWFSLKMPCEAEGCDRCSALTVSGLWIRGWFLFLKPLCFLNFSVGFLAQVGRGGGRRGRPCQGPQPGERPALRAAQPAEVWAEVGRGALGRTRCLFIMLFRET